MHVHVGSAVNSLGTFLSVLILGTLWRLMASHLTVLGGRIGGVGRAMAFQY